MTIMEELVDSVNNTPRETVADRVYQLLLRRVVKGDLAGGQDLQDQLWSDILGVSRTPVREAILRLRSLGILNVAPARYTRLMTFTPATAHEEARHWTAIHETVIISVLPTVTKGFLEELNEVRQTHEQSAKHEQQAVNFGFFAALRAASPSYGLQLGASAAAYRFRLAEHLLPHNPAGVRALHTGIINALESGEAAVVQHTLARWTHTLSQDAV